MTRAAKGIRVDGVVDIECANWIHYVTGAIYSPREGHRVHRSIGHLVDALIAKPGWYWAWSGGTYDFLCIAKELHRRGLPCRVHPGGSRATRLECGDLKLCDAYALIPLDLDTACGLAGEAPVGPIGWRCQCGANCGGYCRISVHLSESRLRELEGYCVEDARKGYRILAWLVTWAAEHGVTLRGTLGGSAWATAADWIGLPKCDWHYSTWNRVRDGYYGGRTTVMRAHATGGAHYDISSSYPASLARIKVPIGDPVEVGSDAMACYGAGTPGIYHATVNVPESDLPPLPYRLPSGRLSFPFGVLRGSWTALELAAAERRGCEIFDIDTAIVWDDSAVIFDQFVDQVWEWRAAAGKKSALGKWLRLFANALPGKLAEQPERQGIEMFPEIESIFLCTGASERSKRSGCTADYCTERCGRWKPLDPHCTIWAVPRYRIGGSAHVQWAAYALADARLAWLEGAEQVGAENLLYGATDSLWVASGGPDNVGDGLGQFEYQGMIGDWICYGPGAYQYVDGNTGECVVRVAGLHSTSTKAWLTEREREIVESRGVLTFREAAATGDLFAARQRVIRRPDETGWRGDRILADSGGRTYACDRATLEARDRTRSGRHQAT